MLGLDRVGVHDPFSTSADTPWPATRILSRVIERFDVELPVGLLFETPTVADLAEVLARCPQRSQESPRSARSSVD